jgi:hypothetical protein
VVVVVELDVVVDELVVVVVVVVVDDVVVVVVVAGGAVDELVVVVVVALEQTCCTLEPAGRGGSCVPSGTVYVPIGVVTCSTHPAAPAPGVQAPRSPTVAVTAMPTNSLRLLNTVA